MIPPFAIVAEIPLGIYRGHVASGDVDMFPSVARLHAALLSAAASGSRAELADDFLMPCSADLAALQWLESHPCDGVALPRTKFSRTVAVAYRELGLFDSRNKQPIMRRLGKPAVVSVAVDGPFAWVWDEMPPGEVAASLDALCSDVPYLGTAETPVRLRTAQFSPTHRLEDRADLFSGKGLDIEVPQIGRTEELINQERRIRSISPSSSQDRWRKNEDELSAPPERVALTMGRYRSVEPGAPLHPWSQAFLVSLDRAIDPVWRVRWAVSAHRALVALVGNEAPPLLTGVYPEGAKPPANRVAIQFLGQETLSFGNLDAPATLAVLIPEGVVDTDADVIAQALSQLKQIRGPGGRIALRRDRPISLTAREFWQPVAAGCRRLWLTVPAAVPDTRPPRRKEWSMADAVALSIGLVWREHLVSPGRGANWQLELAGEVRSRGVSVQSLQMITQGDLTRFVHRINAGAIVRPYEALVDLGNLAAPQGIAAIGQSRHLGGGLLRPIDVSVQDGEGKPDVA